MFKPIRLAVANAVNEEGMSRDEAAKKFGVPVRAIAGFMKKHYEIKVVRGFFEAIGEPYLEVTSLAEFHQCDRHPGDNRPLDTVSPDTIATLPSGIARGIEATAYTDLTIQQENSWHSRMQRIRRIVRDRLASDYPTLRGHHIFYSPDPRCDVKLRDEEVARLILEAAKGFIASSPFIEDDIADIPLRFPYCRFRADLPLMSAGIQSVSVAYIESLKDQPVDLPVSGIPAFLGLSVESLQRTIQRKNRSLATAYKHRLDSIDLLIHAIGSPQGSRMSPTSHFNFDEYESSPLKEVVENCDFGRVFVWDGRFCGALELRSQRRFQCSGT